MTFPPLLTGGQSHTLGRERSSRQGLIFGRFRVKSHLGKGSKSHLLVQPPSALMGRDST